MYKNISNDKWLSSILQREVFRININDSFFKDDTENLIINLQKKQNIFLYSYVPVRQVSIAKFFTEHKFCLIDTNIQLTKSITTNCNFKGNASMRFARPEDQSQVVDIASNNFTYTRFHMDKNIPIKLANKIKAEWVKSYFFGKRGEYMVVALVTNKIKGFLQLLQGDSGKLIIDLITVEHNSRQKGIASDMIMFAEKNCKGSKYIQSGTQITNTPSLRMYENLGFRMIEAYYIFHYHHLNFNDNEN